MPPEPTRRAEYARLIVELLDRAAGAPVAVRYLYELIAAERPDLVDAEPDPFAPGRPKWEHDVRWELQTAVTAGAIIKRSELGRGLYSSVRNQQAQGRGSAFARIAPIEAIPREPVVYETRAAHGERQQIEGDLAHRYEEWCLKQGRPVGRLEQRTPEGERVAADIYDLQQHQLVEAKARPDRPSMRMALGQLLDYATVLGTKPSLAILVPSTPAASVLRFLHSYGVAVLVETSSGRFEEHAPADGLSA